MCGEDVEPPRDSEPPLGARLVAGSGGRHARGREGDLDQGAVVELAADPEARPVRFRQRLGERQPEPGPGRAPARRGRKLPERDRKSTRLNSSHGYISYAV